MTASLPPEVQQVFEKFLTTEFTTVDARGRPICWPLTPYYTPGGEIQAGYDHPLDLGEKIRRRNRAGEITDY